MLALQITNLKTFMNKLLTGDIFDIFLLEEAIISTANTYTIDGHINKEFFHSQEPNQETLPYDLQPWSELKGLCFHLIKGRHTPLFFKFVFHLKPETTAALLKRETNVIDDTTISQLKALVLTIKYDGSKAVLTTGTSFHTFVMNKEPDIIWDKTLSKYLSDKEISYEPL